MLRDKQSAILNTVTMLVVALLCLIAVPEAYAADAGGGGAFANAEARCQQIRQEVEGTDIDGVYLTEYVVKCVKTVIQEAFERFIEEFYPYVEASITAALTLAVTIFGALMLAGMIEKASRDSFVFLFKFACVLFFVLPATAREIYQMGIDGMDGLTDLVFTFGKGAGNSPRCIDNATVWDRVDCMLDMLVGIKKNANGGGGGAAQVEGISRGIMHFNFSSMFAKGGLGFMIGAIMMYVTFTIVVATLKSIQTYLAGVLGLAFMLIFEPMFVPMIMFKVSREYFNKWHRIATSMVLQPVILFGFLSFMMIAMEKMMCSGNGSFLKTTFGAQGCQKDKFPGEEMENRGAIVPKNTTFGVFTGPNAARESQGKLQDYGALGGQAVVRDQRRDPKKELDSRYSPLQSYFDSVDYSKLCQGGGDAAKCSEQVGYSAILMALTAFVFISMLNYIPNLAADLSGGLYEVPNLYAEVGSKLPGGEALEKKLSEAGNKIADGFKSMVGLR